MFVAGFPQPVNFHEMHKYAGPYTEHAKRKRIDRQIRTTLLPEASHTLSEFL